MVGEGGDKRPGYPTDRPTHHSYTMFDLPELPYSFTALEPYIDAQTMQLHHDMHHKAYVTKLNDALEVRNPFFLIRNLITNRINP